MSSKRVAAREWKRKRKQQKQATKLAIAGVCVLAIAIIGYIGWDLWSRTYVMTFEGQRISTADMRDFMTAGAEGVDPRAQALEGLTQFLLINQAAHQNNIALTAEDWAGIEANITQMREMYEAFGMDMPDISDERMTELMSMEILSERLMDIYTADFEIDEADFEEALIQYLTFNRADHVDMNFRYHISDSMIAARIAQDDLFAVGPDGFDEIIIRDMALVTGQDEADIEVPTITLAELRQVADISFTAVNDIISLEAGQLSDPIQLDENTYMVLIVDFVNIPADEEIEEIFLEQYTRQQRVMIFSDIVEGWREVADIRINQRGVNAA